MPQPYDALAVANFFIERALLDGGEGVDPMKLQKLVYFANGWNLGLNDRPLINEAVEAWKYGPVIPTLYHKFRAYGADPIDMPGENREYTGERWEPKIPAADSGTIALLQRIWDTYGRFSGPELSTMTHKPGSPWDVTWKEALQDGITVSRDIPESRIREYFAQLAHR